MDYEKYQELRLNIQYKRNAYACQMAFYALECVSFDAVKRNAKKWQHYTELYIWAHDWYWGNKRSF